MNFLNDNKNTEITPLGIDLLEKTTNRINQKVIKIVIDSVIINIYLDHKYYLDQD